MMRSSIFILILLLGLNGCGHDAGVVFPTGKTPLKWPAPPDPPRIQYVGKLTGSADLKPAVSSLQNVGRTLFGPDQTYSMQAPMAVTTDGACRVFVADTAEHVIHVFDLKTRDYQRWTPTGFAFKSPVGVAYDRGGSRLLVADSEIPGIFVFNSQGKFLGQFPSGIVRRPCGLAVDPTNGRVFVADVEAHQIIVLSPSGELIQRVGQRGDAPGQFNYRVK